MVILHYWYCGNYILFNNFYYYILSGPAGHGF